MGRSLIAGANAWFRAKESTLPAEQRVLHDPWAEPLAERNPRVLLVRFARFLWPPLARQIRELRAAHCVRHRAIDELVLSAVLADGFRQVVLVGAGYDMRSARFAERAGGVRWIEVDLPASLARKERILAGLELPSASVERVPIDLLHQSLAEALGRSSFDPSLPTCVVAEGLIHYLPRERVEQLLDVAGCIAARARVVLSFIRSDMYLRATPMFVQLVKTMREIPVLHFTVEGMAALCAAHGLARFQSWTYAEQVDRFVPEARGRTAALTQDVAQADHVQ